MAKRPGADDEMLTSPTILRNFAADLNAGDVNMDCGDGAEDVSLEEILSLYSQPINEEQAWAMCYQCCRTLAQKHRRKGFKSAGASAADYPRRIQGPGNVRIRRDGTVRLDFEGSTDAYQSAATSLEVIDSLGVMIYKALDYGLKENEERELSPPLERLIDMMTNTEQTECDPCPDEGYEATEEEDECEEDEGEEELVSVTPAGTISGVQSYRDIIVICSSHLPRPSDASKHYQAVCRALYAESRELCTFLDKIKSAKENLRKMEGDTREAPVKDLDELQNADWARFWVQVMRDLRHGVKLKKVQERQYNPLPIEYQLTPYEMLMDDIRSKRYKLRKVMVNGDIPLRLKKSAHEIILDFIRSRPPLKPVSARKLKPHPQRPRSLHERLLEGIKAERKLRPVSPDMIRRHRLVMRPLSMSYSFDSSGAGKSFSTPQDLFRSSDTPDAPRKLAGSTQSLSSGTTGANQAGQPLSQRKRLLRAPTLAELDSSESEEEPTRSSSSMSTSLVEDTSPESVVEKKAPPKFLPVSATPQPDRRQSPQRRHSIEKEAPTSVRPFVPPSRQSSKSLVEAAGGAQGTEEFCYPVECLALTVEEVMHIRQVLVKAELEKFQQYKDIYNALKKGKLCFSCRTKKFSLFTWAYTCQFCKRPVCSQCSKKMRLPSKPYSTLPIYSLGPSAMAKDEAGAAPASAETKKHPFGSGHSRHSLRRSVYKFSKHSSSSTSKDGRSQDEPELPKELTEDWVTMEVCVDCKKFITEIISSSKRSLCVATKRARLNRKTQSFYMSSSSSRDFRSSERTIKEA
ncbi:protein spire homolog 1 isoform 2-T2 [Odontesthes bonariensis]|uniref:protein spire homolog 1 isoform X2 n=1 Tax=Odontesthes bonariensis TaxID=219752 RepID=UPI003F581AF5